MLADTCPITSNREPWRDDHRLDRSFRVWVSEAPRDSGQARDHPFRPVPGFHAPFDRQRVRRFKLAHIGVERPHGPPHLRTGARLKTAADRPFSAARASRLLPARRPLIEIKADASPGTGDAPAHSPVRAPQSIASHDWRMEPGGARPALVQEIGTARTTTLMVVANIALELELVLGAAFTHLAVIVLPGEIDPLPRFERVSLSRGLKVACGVEALVAGGGVIVGIGFPAAALLGSAAATFVLVTWLISRLPDPDPRFAKILGTLALIGLVALVWALHWPDRPLLPSLPS